jgi:hypothetical protein
LAKETLVASTPIKDLYSSSNGDRWILTRAPSGALLVSHVPNAASGGQPSEIEVESFLRRDGGGGGAGGGRPERQALLAALATLAASEGTPDTQAHEELAAETVEKLSRALGQAVARCWSRLPPDIQHDLFEAAVTSEGEPIRQELAIYLHGKHARTLETLQTRAMPEPDSLGG